MGSTYIPWLLFHLCLGGDGWTLGDHPVIFVEIPQQWLCYYCTPANHRSYTLFHFCVGDEDYLSLVSSNLKPDQRHPGWLQENLVYKHYNLYNISLTYSLITTSCIFFPILINYFIHTVWSNQILTYIILGISYSMCRNYSLKENSKATFFSIPPLNHIILTNKFCSCFNVV